MQVVKGSHRLDYDHQINEKENYILNQEVDKNSFKTEDIVSIDLKSGEISLHNDKLLHGSGPNNSNRIRVGQTIRFCPTEVKCDLSIWPTFESYLVRGVDKFNHNPIGKVPKGYNHPTEIGQGSWEFE